MATITPAVLASTTLTNAVATYITGITGGKTIIKRLVLTNSTAGAITASVYRVPSGGTATTATLILTRSIAASSTDLAPELANMVLGAGDTIQALATANTSINVFSSGFTVV